MCLIRLCYVLQAVDLKKNSSSEQLSGPLSQNNYQAPQPQQPVQQAPPAYTEPVAPKAAIVQEPEAPKPVPASIPQQQPAPQPTEQVPSAQQPTAPPQTGPARRISKNMLDEGDAMHLANAVGAAQQELTLQIATEVFDKYRALLKEQNRSVYHAQFSSLSVEVLPPDEVRIVAPSDLADTYAREERNKLIDFFRAQTGITQLRITTEVREDKSVTDNERKVVLSKQEMYDAMAQKNPYLDQLKNNLNLQIEY